MLPHPLRSKYAEIQPLKAGGGDGCEVEMGLGVEVGGDRVVEVIVEIEVVITVEMVLVVITVGFL